MRVLLTCALIGALAASCAEPIEPAPGAGSDSECTTCHGDPLAPDPAPPPAIWRDGRVEDAHRAHLAANDWHDGIPCETCHVVPSAVNAPGHIDSDLPAEVILSGISTADDTTARYSSVTSSCSSYCHGNTDENGVAVAWYDTEVELGCASCHGYPPPAPHPEQTNCASCHGDVVHADGTFAQRSLHLNGQVDVAVPDDCRACHGGADGPAPPTDTLGNSDTTLAGVGAHQAHVAGGDWHAAIPCETCHVVPEVVSAAGHVDSGLPAEVVFAGAARFHDADPSYDFEATTCSNGYCHGATLSGGAHPVPDWTLVDGTQASCGSCHGAPPPAPHPQTDQCAACHGEVIGEDGFVAGSRHIDGVLDVGEPSCNSCHGSPGDPALAVNQAPPRDLSGATERSARGVGAHQAHVAVVAAEDAWHVEIGCADCHVVPETTLAAGHIDDLQPAELVWSERATLDGATPSFDTETLSCSGTYCHGSTLAGGSDTSPSWVDEVELDCGSCHGAPPPAPHPDDAVCANCHASVVNDDLSIICAGLHINGRVDFGAEVCP